MKFLWMSKLSFILTFIIMLTILFEISSVVGAPSDTVVSINPKFQTVYPGENFTVEVFCVPGRPIKAFEFKLSFNPTRLKAINVTEGNIFNDYSTFFNEGVINNQAGAITDIYGLILGEGNVIDSGTFVTISFTSKEKIGSYSLDISNVGVTNEIEYVSVDVSDGTVSVKAISDVPPPPPGGPFDDGNEENNPPMIPLKPSGPTYVGLGVEYNYSSSTYDIDVDKVRYRFDWGDGNFSNWSDFVASNKTVFMSHTFDSKSKFGIRVIAQDVYGLNSSWSQPLDVIVSQTISGDKPPIANFSIFGNLYANNTIIFDGSSSFDEDGVIVFYYWDFGDGTNASGINISHIYHKLGSFPVTLIIMDNDGYTYSKTRSVNIFFENEEIQEEELGENKNIVLFDFTNIIILLFVVLLTCFIVLLRNKIITFASSFSNSISQFSQWKIWNKIILVSRKDESIQKISKRIIARINYNQFPYLKSNIQAFKNYYFKEKFDKPIVRKIPSDGFYAGSSKREVFEDFESQVDNIIYNGKVDKPIEKEVSSDGFYAGSSKREVFEDFESQVDNIITREKFNIEKEKISNDLESDDIERKVDDLIASKMQQKIDNL